MRLGVCLYISVCKHMDVCYATHCTPLSLTKHLFSSAYYLGCHQEDTSRFRCTCRRLPPTHPGFTPRFEDWHPAYGNSGNLPHYNLPTDLGLLPGSHSMADLVRDLETFAQATVRVPAYTRNLVFYYMPNP